MEAEACETLPLLQQLRNEGMNLTGPLPADTLFRVIYGGSFMGFPALIYTHGWVLALWIAG